MKTPEVERLSNGEAVTFEVIETTSFVVAGLKVVEDLDQKPTVPELDPVMLPVQVMFPVELATVHPVVLEPPAMFTSTVPSDWRFNPVAWALMFKAPAEFVKLLLPVEVNKRVPEDPKLRLIWLLLALSIDSPFAKVNAPFRVIVAKETPEVVKTF